MSLTENSNQVFLPGGATNSQNSPYISVWPLDHGEWLCFCVALTILTFVIVSIRLVKILNWNLRILRNNIACEFFLLIKFSSINSINSLIPWSSVFVT